jgi:TRAP-type C4-dicarboxylate transport system permease small subunit
MKSVLAFSQGVLKRLAELCMVALALLTLADVLGRYVFNVSLVGAVELTEMLMVGVIFTGVVLATQAREHVVVDLVPMPFGRTGKRVMHAASQALAAGISALLGMVTWSRALSALDYGDQTTMLGLPLAPTVFFMSIMLFVNAVVVATQLWVDLRTGAIDD